MPDGSNVVWEADRGREEVMQLELQGHGGDDRHWELTVFWLMAPPPGLGHCAKRQLAFFTPGSGYPERGEATPQVNVQQRPVVGSRE